MQALRLPIGVISSVAMLLAQMPPGFAQNTVPPPAQPVAFSPGQDATPSPAIVDAFKAYPKGGDLLSKRIEDIIVGNPKLAPGLAKYVQTAPDLTKEQRQAAFRGFAAALNRLGIKAADMPLKAPPPEEAPPPPPEGNYLWLLGLAAMGGIICLAVCQEQHREVPVSP
jgi:hypothetical protein